MRTAFVEPGAFPRLGPLGRGVRLLIGFAVLWWAVVPFLRYQRAFTAERGGWSLPGGDWYVAVLPAVFLLPSTIDRLLGVHWAWRTQAAWGALATALAALDFVFYRVLWAPPLGWFVLSTVVAVFGITGVAFLAQAAAATPG